MILVTDIDVWGFQHAIRGMRNPMNSWEKSDTRWCGDWECDPDGTCQFRTEHGCDGSPGECVLGDADSNLMHRLFKAGTEHRKFMRQIFVSMDIIAPLYWWKEFDTYKVGTTANSCSTMHKIAAKPFDLDDFSHEHLLVNEKLNTVIQWLNDYREMYVNWVDSSVHVDDYGNVVKKKDIWWQMIQLLPSSYNQKRTVTISYENAAAMIRQRTGHKLDEWRVFVDQLKSLPHMDTIINGDWGEYADNDTAQSGLSSAT